MASNKELPVARGPPLLQHQPGGADSSSSPGGNGSGSPWLLMAGLAYLTLSSAMALCRSWPDPGAVAFIVFAYADLVLLFSCLRRYERAEPGSALRDRLKVAIWTLTAALTLSFSYKVAAVMPPAAAALVWVMGLTTVTGGFVAFFCFKKKT